MGVPPPLRLGYREGVLRRLIGRGGREGVKVLRGNRSGNLAVVRN